MKTLQNVRSSFGPWWLLLAAVLGLYLLVLVPNADAQSSFDEWKQQQDEAFESFLSEEDAAFSAFLEKEWMRFQAFVSRGYYDEPKLDDPPKIRPEDRRDDPKVRPPEESRDDPATPPRDDPRGEGAGEPEGPPADDPEVPPEDDPSPPREQPDRDQEPREERPAPREPPRESPARPERPEPGRVLEVEFHGIRAPLELPAEVSELRLEERSPDGFAAYWSGAAGAGTDRLVESLRETARRHALNDYTYFQLVLQTVGAIYDREQDAAAAAWYLMVKSGFDMRIAYGDRDLALLLPSTNNIYGVSFFSGEDRRYYLLNPDGTPVRSAGQWRTYQGNHDEAADLVGLSFPPTPGVPERIQRETLEFSYAGEEFTITLPVNQHVVSLLRDYPFTDWYVHFAPSVSRSARGAMVDQLGRIVRGRDAADAANLLLRFVQTAFPYQTDQEHFGYEKWQSPEEILYYRLSDCDDRSVLYAYLLEEVMGWDDIAVLNYPGHLAIAVPQQRLGVDGDAVVHEGVRYIVTDPTYIGANIGMAMPQYRDVQPTVYTLDERPRGGR